MLVKELGRFISVVILFIACIQLSNAQTDQDCLGALPICGGDNIIGNYSGGGAITDLPAKGADCLTGEINSVWLIFQTDATSAPGATCIFTIIPELGSLEDFDFAVFGPDKPCNNLGNPIRCSAAPAKCINCPNTGLSLGEPPPNSEDKVKGDGLVPFFVTQPGQVYYILVNNFKGSAGGFNIQLYGSSVYNCHPNPPCELFVTLPPDMEVCQAASTPFQIVPGISPDYWSNALISSWSADPDIALQFLNDPNSKIPEVTIPENFSGNILYTYTGQIPNGGCSNSKTISINVKSAPDLTIEQVPELCYTAKPYTVKINPAGGTFDIFAPIQNGIIDPSYWGAGNYPFTYTYTYPNGCVRSADSYVNIVQGPTAEIDYVDEFCVTDTITKLFAYDAGGKWGGAANKNGEIDPKKLGPGVHTVTYTVTDGICKNS
ncbi:MAG TPA: hypothetical protein VK590_11515, partial [Saprospiraceae bacterium]|nr:hypothetical protein [Saprospiraceae bacterium]